MREGCTYKELGNLCTIKGRIGFRGYTREDLVNEGQGAITLSPSNIIEDKLDLSKCSFISWFKYEESPEIMVFNGDIIYAKTASIGKVAIIDNLPEKATINPQFVVLKEIKCDNKYLYYALRSSFFKEQASSIVRGVAIPTISQANLSLLKIPVPSLQEQKRIVVELDLLAGIIDKQKQQLKELDTLAQSIFYDMFGSPDANEKEWIMKSLAEIGTIVSGSTPSTSDESNWDGDVNWVTPAELGVQLFYGETRRKITSKAAKSLTIMPIGTLLMSSRAPIGKLAITSVPMCCNQGFKNIVCGNNVNNIYLYYCLMLNINSIKAMGRGATFKEVSKQAVSSFEIMLPPMNLQELFAQKILSIESQKKSINRSIAESQKLFDYTMDKYFG